MAKQGAKQGRSLFLGAALGAGVLYLLDATQGRRRRARIRDKLVHAAHKGRDGADAVAHDMENRARGLVAMLAGLFRPEDCPDAVLESRVRSRLGRIVSHPASIQVRAEHGRISLSGPILAVEVEPLLDEVRRVRGVRSIEERLEIHEQPGNVPGLQGGPERSPEYHRFELMQSNWSPAARFVAGSAAAALTGYGMRRGGMLGAMLATGGAGLFARAATNMETRRLLGLGAGRRAVDIQKTVHFAVPVDRVYRLWRDCQDFPKFMTHVRDVQRLDRDRWRWIVGGPAGTVTWDAVYTQQVDNELLAWRTEAGSMIQHAGQVRFRPEGEDATLVEIRLSYNPVVGALGHALALVLGMDPQRLLDHDLLRMKSFLETGHVPRDAAKRELAEAEAKARKQAEEGGSAHPVH